MFYGHFASTLIFLISFKSCLGNKSPAKIWGFEGEAWKTELLLDYSFTGFAAKERGFPEPPFAANILDFGAIGDGVVDCTGPFLGAIDHVNSVGGGTIIIPAGKYLLKQRIVLDGNNVVLRGEGPLSTMLYFDEPLSHIDDRDVDTLLRKRDGLVQSPYAWNDGVLQIKGRDTGSHSPNGRHDPGWIVENASIGSRKLRLNSVAGLAPGQWVRVIQSDVNGTLASNLYGTNSEKMEAMKREGIECEPECATDIDNERDLLRWGSRILAIESHDVVVLQRSLPFDVSTTWKARLLPIPSSMAKENGIKDLSIEFKWERARPHHHDVGYNAILIENAFNTYIQNVHVVNVEQGFLLKNAQLATLDRVKVRTTRSRKSSSISWDGHIGIGLYDCSDVEVSNFDIRGEWLHDISLRGTTLSAIHSGRGDNLRLDTHRSAPYAILFSNIYLGKGSRPFGTGGYLSRGLPVARFTTYYNLRRANWSPIDMPGSTVAGECTWGKKVNYIGAFKGKKCPGYHIESYPMGSLIPEDIYSSMVDRKAHIRAIYQGGVVPYSEQKLVRNALQSAAIGEDSSQLPSSAAGDGSYPLIPEPEFY